MTASAASAAAALLALASLAAYAALAAPNDNAALAASIEVGGIDAGAAPPGTVEVRGLGAGLLRRLVAGSLGDTAWTPALALYVDAAAGAPAAAPVPVLPPVLAHYEVRGDRVRLTPRFPITPGVAYRVRLDPGALARLAGARSPGAAAPAVERRFAVARRELARTTRVVAVHPAADRVPANLLRWYVELSAPMEPGEALANVRLLDEAGREVRGAFLEVGEELWDPARRRLTVLFDPGRVKRGVRTNVEAGAPLVAGRRYRLVIDAAWRDGRGAPLASGFEREFEAGPSDRQAPDVARWHVEPPRAGTREPLRVAFGEPLDHALASRLLAVHGPDGGRVAGVSTPETGDTAWRFVPDRPWHAGEHTLRAHASLEDLAGNSLARVFDADRRAGDPSAEQGAAAAAWRGVRFSARSR